MAVIHNHILDMWGYGMMGGGGVFGILFSIVVLVDLILVGVWLWQHISRK